MRKYQKMSKFLAIAILAVGLTGCANSVTSLTENVIGEGSGSGELVSIGKKSFENNEFNSIHVNTKAMEVHVTKSSDDRAVVELLTDKAIENRFTFDTSLKSKALNIDVDEEDANSFNFSTKGQKGERKLLISLPDKTYDQVTIQNDFGLVEATDLKMDSVDIKVDAGAIRLNRVSGDMNLKTDAGKIEVEGISLENDLSASTDTGEIIIHLNESPKAAKVYLKADVGKVTADLEGMQYNVNSTNKKIGTIGSNGHRLEATTNVGAIRVDVK